MIPIHIVTSAIIENDNGDILMVRQKKWGNQWTLPGGHVEEGETILAAAKREAVEETGLELEEKGLICFGEEISPKEFERKVHVIFFHIHFRALTTDFVLEANEIQEGKWVAPKDLHTLEIPLGFQKCLNSFMKIKNGEATKPEFLSIT